MVQIWYPLAAETFKSAVLENTADLDVGFCLYTYRYPFPKMISLLLLQTEVEPSLSVITLIFF